MIEKLDIHQVSEGFDYYDTDSVVLGKKVNEMIEAINEIEEKLNKLSEFQQTMIDAAKEGLSEKAREKLKSEVR